MAHLYMGCGITKESVPEKEWIETVNKSTTMKRVIV
jgi:isochorismate synthase